MLFSEATGRKVVSIATAQSVGRIDEFAVDPATHTIRALVLGKASGGHVLRWDAIAAFGADAVTVTGADVTDEGDEQIEALSGKHHRMLGKRVLTTRGDDLGSLADVEFDAGTGEILALHLKDHTVEGGHLRGVGSYAVVVEDSANR